MYAFLGNINIHYLPLRFVSSFLNIVLKQLAHCCKEFYNSHFITLFWFHLLTSSPCFCISQDQVHLGLPCFHSIAAAPSSLRPSNPARRQRRNSALLRGNVSLAREREREILLLVGDTDEFRRSGHLLTRRSNRPGRYSKCPTFAGKGSC